MSSNKKPSVCNRCYTEVNWNNEKRAAMGTKRPLTSDGTAVHECPKDGAGNIVMNQTNKALYDAWVANSPSASTVQTLQAPPPPPQQQQQQPSHLGLSQADMEQILTVTMARINEMTAQQKQFTDAVLRIESIMEAQRKVLQDYITYDPVGTQLNRVIDTLLRYIPQSELTPQTANQLMNKDISVKADHKKTIKDVEQMREDESLAERKNW